ncbi:MAG: tetratricopeptide repeat protein [Bryobacteraceae bacterium]
MTAVLCLLLAFQITPELRQHIDAGMKAKSAGDLDTAIREFKRVAELAPDLAAAHVNLGAVYLGKKDYGAAVPALRRALTLKADLPGAHAMLGTALLAQGFGCESIPHLEKGQSNDLLGVALLECGRPREALDRLEAALEKRANDPDLLYYLSRAHVELARLAFDRLRAASPDSARTEQALGEGLASGGNRAAAEKHFRAALSMRPDLRGVHFALGELLLQASDYEKAEAEFRAEVQLSPGSGAAAYKLGSVLANLGRTTDAIAELKRANELQPDMPETLLELGKVLNASGEPKSAETYLKAVLAAEQDTELAESAHFQLSQVYRKLGRPAEADREMRTFQELRSRRGEK